jgi:hypothetical protein
VGSRTARRHPHRGDRTRVDIRCVVTSLRIGGAEWVYDSLYCARGQTENLIKLHKTQLASDRTSCRSALANQVRLVFNTAAYWLVLAVRDLIPKPRDLATAEFNTIRLRLLKIAARVVETATRVRLAFAAACPEADLFRGLANALMHVDPDPPGMSPAHPKGLLQRVCKVRVRKRHSSRSRRAPSTPFGNVPVATSADHE